MLQPSLDESEEVEPSGGMPHQASESLLMRNKSASNLLRSYDELLSGDASRYSTRNSIMTKVGHHTYVDIDSMMSLSLGSLARLLGLTNTEYQDQLIVVPGAGAIAGLAGVGAIRRRRRRA